MMTRGMKTAMKQQTAEYPLLISKKEQMMKHKTAVKAMQKLISKTKKTMKHQTAMKAMQKS